VVYSRFICGLWFIRGFRVRALFEVFVILFCLFANFAIYLQFLRFIRGFRDLFVVYLRFICGFRVLFLVFVFYSRFLCFIRLQLKYLDNLRAYSFSKSYFEGLILLYLSNELYLADPWLSISCLSVLKT
jgi:hypothetical protein